MDIVEPAIPGAGGSIRPPLKIRDVRPIYPPALADADVTGTVLMDATIAVDGSVRNVAVTKSAHQDLDRSAIEAVKQWQFTETLLNCTPVEVTTRSRRCPCRCIAATTSRAVAE